MSVFSLTVIWVRSTKSKGIDAPRSGWETVLNIQKDGEVISGESAVSIWQKSMRVFLMPVIYLILPPALLLQNDLQKTVLTSSECWKVLKLVLHIVMTNWKKQLDEFSSSVVWLLQRDCVSETQQTETKKLLPLAVDLWSGSDWCCVAANSSRWCNINSDLYYLQTWMMKQKNNLCRYLTLHLCYNAFTLAQAHLEHYFLERTVLFVYLRALMVISLLQCDQASPLPTKCRWKKGN